MWKLVLAVSTKAHASGDDHYRARSTQVVTIFTQTSGDHYRLCAYNRSHSTSMGLPKFQIALFFLL